MTSRTRSAILAGILTSLLLQGAGVHAGPPAPTNTWKTSMTLGLHLTRGNNDTFLMNASLSTEYERGAQAARLGTEGAYGETRVETGRDAVETETTTQNAKSYANYTYTFGYTFGYLVASVLHDDMADINYRLIASPGIGCRLIDSARQRLEIEIGPGYLHENVADVEKAIVTIRTAQRYTYRFNKTARLWQALEYLPESASWQDYLINAEVGIEAALSSKLSLRVVAQDKLDKTPAPGKEQNDLSVIAGVRFLL